MTISTAASPLSYAGNGSTTDFAITWAYIKKSHVVATLRDSGGAETVQVLVTNYTLTDPGPTGTLTMNVAPASGETLVITLEPPTTQETNLPIGGPFPAQSVEDALDVQSQVSQKIESLFNRSIRVPKTDTVSGTDLEMPNETDRAGKFLSFGVDGKPVATSVPPSGGAVVSSFAETYLDDLTAPATRATLGLGNLATQDDSANLALSGDITLSGSLLIATGGTFGYEGSVDDFETLFSFDNPTADRTIGIPDRDVDLADLTTVPDVDASVATNALTATLNPCTLAFRSATLTVGTPTVVDVPSVITVTAPSGATLGTINAVKSRIVILAINNAGTVELAVMNLDGGASLNEQGVISTTAIDATSDTKGVAYSDTARSNVAYRVVGIIESTQATAGTWATTPTLVAPSFGNALASMDSIGYGQTWQDVTGSRSKATLYYNDTGKPIQVLVTNTNSPGTTLSFTVDGVQIAFGRINDSPSGLQYTIGGIVPPGSSYQADSSTTFSDWHELR